MRCDAIRRAAARLPAKFIVVRVIKIGRSGVRLAVGRSPGGTMKWHEIQLKPINTRYRISVAPEEGMSSGRRRRRRCRRESRCIATCTIMNREQIRSISGHMELLESICSLRSNYPLIAALAGALFGQQDLSIRLARARTVRGSITASR